jgi:signal transduction histidine kinase/ligand-binding sensor domain-containing protein
MNQTSKELLKMLSYHQFGRPVTVRFRCGVTLLQKWEPAVAGQFSLRRALYERIAWNILVLCFLFAPLAWSESKTLRLAQLDHTSWTTKDGAPLIIQDMVQGNDGTIWLAAGNGLYNFNGITFAPFQFQQSDLQVPFCVYVDRTGNLWVGFGIRGIAEIRNHKVIRTYGEGDGLPGGQVKMITQGPDGTIAAIARGQLVELRSGRWVQSVAASATLGSDVQRIFFDRKGTLWAATRTYIWKLPIGDREFEKVSQAGGLDTYFAEAPDGTVWAQNQLVDPAQSFTRRISGGDLGRAVPDRIRSDGVRMLFDWNGLLWMGSTDTGVLRVLPTQTPQRVADRRGRTDGFSIEHYPSLEGLSHIGVYSMMMDNAGDIWVGTSAGLDRFRRPNLVRFFDKQLAETGVAITQCPRGDLWLGVPQSSAISMRDGVVKAHGPKREFIAAHCDAANVVWMTSYQGLWRYSDDTSRNIPPPVGIPPVFIRQLVGKSDHLLFASITRNGLWQYSDGTWTRVAAPNLPDITPTSLLMDSRGRLWTGYIDNRVAVFDGGRAHVFSGDKARPLGMVQVFLESPSGIFVGATNGIAILRGERLETLQTLDQVDVRGVSGLLQAANGDLWLNGLHGIVRIPARELADALKSPGHQMQSELIAEAGIVGPSPQVLEVPSAVEDSHGLFWFVTTNNVVSVDPSAIKRSTMPPILTGISMTVDGRPLPNAAQVSPGYHTLRINYLGAYVTAPEKVSYKYRLEGVDQAWQDVGSRTEAVYTGLRPGTYRFSIVASNGEGAWSQPDESQQFTVLPSFYQKPIFVILCILTAVGLLWLAYRLRIRYIAAAIRTSEMVRADERIHIARDLHDTLLQGVQGLTLRVGAAAKQLPEGSRTRESLERALASADRLLEEGRNRVSRLRTHDLTNQALVQGLKAIGAELNHENQARFDVGFEGRTADVSPSVLGELFYIGREAITNAFHHSQASEISVVMRCLPSATILVVADNGTGFEVEAFRGTPTNGHWGIHGMNERAQAMGAIFKCMSKSNLGTEITVTVPARRAYLKGSRRPTRLRRQK